MSPAHEYPSGAARSTMENRLAFWFAANAAALEGMTRMAALNASAFSDAFRNGVALLHALGNPYFPQEVLSWMLNAHPDLGGFSSYRRHAADIISETWEKTARAAMEEGNREGENVQEEMALVQFANAPAAGWARATAEALNLGYSAMENAATRMAGSPRRET